jgi:hypothetical protein
MRFKVTRTEKYSREVEAESSEALLALLDSDHDVPAFVELDESLDYEECWYDFEEVEADK